MFEEVDEIVVQESDLPFIAGRLAEPVQPNLLRMRALLSACKHNIVLVDGVENASITSPLLFLFTLKDFVCYESDIIVMELTDNCTDKQSRTSLCYMCIAGSSSHAPLWLLQQASVMFCCMSHNHPSLLHVTQPSFFAACHTTILLCCMLQNHPSLQQTLKWLLHSIQVQVLHVISAFSIVHQVDYQV